MFDTVDGALAVRGQRSVDAVLDELGVGALLKEGGSTFDAALVAEAAGRHGVVIWPDERIMTVAACVGMATRALEDASAYACERVVFGRRIGEYQGVAHTLANAITEIEGTRLLVWRAIAARAEALAEAPRLDVQAFWWAAKAVLPAIKAAMRTFGGYGVSDDSPLPALYLAARAALYAGGDPDHILTAPLPVLAPADPVSISFTPDAEAAAWQARTEIFLEQFTPDEKAAFAGSSDNHLPELHRRLAAAGLLFPDWPLEWGGSGASALATSAVHRTLTHAGWPISVLVVSDSIGKLLMMFGTAEAKAEVLPRLARGEAIACLGLSEPSGGSDVFGARTRAVHDGARWIANGQKVFTTTAHQAEYVLLLARNEDGLTLFVAPLGQGFDLAPVQTFAGERTNITFYSDFAIEDRYLLGEASKGAKVLAATMTLEHNQGDYYLGALDFARAELLAGLDDLLERPEIRANEPAIRHSLARLDAHVALLESLSLRAIWAGDAGEGQRWFGPMCKLFGTESWHSCCAELVERFAPLSLDGTIPALAAIEKEARCGIQATIYGGANEIQRSVIAETRLNLPRSR
ncbi:alkylation response protein AidB-like acyl-CoA dehydrogenase [Novosphingobium kunmingense]|uniref:Alkylation response protein AidB-like acyl-CoA dehydrogenase n=1 Tax=Novosphingobium kunmingense TaxID=1211806 RepID=A0A2N0H5Y8_9SPHN|nr:acyl-CoA dehydrogenase [Novosphingobium kunmingense]PKB14344.1 alkylation response protein AidB-like acyl-CoA dehydrogenase [Novosphingobium kunmingense]